MEQLNYQDAGFVYQETDNTPMHICGFGIYDSGESRPLKNKADFVSYLGSRLQSAPILKQKLHDNSGGWERPYWVHDEDFDLNNHVEVIVLDAPGNREQLLKAVSEAISLRLDLSKPLWKTYVFEGLRDYDGVSENAFAILTKIHHCCVDGSSGDSVLMAIHDFVKEPKPLGLPASEEPTPLNPIIVDERGHFESQALMFGNNVLNVVSQSTAVSKRMPGLLKTAMQLYKGDRKAGAQLKVPATRFNKTPKGGRLFSFTDFSLDEIKQIKNAYEGITVNDVMVCVVSGGLRRYLDHHGELPNESLGAMLPQNTRSADANDKHGNQVGGLFASIHTDIEDPVQRIKAIHQSVADAKRFAEEESTGAILPHMMGGFMYPKVGKAVAKYTQKFGLMEKAGPVIFNTIITNVAGPNFPMYHQGSQMNNYCGVLTLTDGCGLGNAIYSFDGKISLSMVSCESMMTDPEFYIDCCREAYEELKVLSLPETKFEKPATVLKSA